MDVARISNLAERAPDRLSGGQAQLVALAAVLALRPSALVLDEPTSQLDPAGTILVGETLVRMAREAGTALLIVEHKTDLLARIADQVVVLAEGRVALGGRPTACWPIPAWSVSGWSHRPPFASPGRPRPPGLAQRLPPAWPQ